MLSDTHIQNDQRSFPARNKCLLNTDQVMRTDTNQTHFKFALLAGKNSISPGIFSSTPSNYRSTLA
jgi:hypothetical protein